MSFSKVFCLAVAAVSVIALACSTSGDASEERTSERPSDVVVPEFVLQNAKNSGLDYQAAVIADLTITFTEYETSVLAYVGCLTEKGWEVREGFPALTARNTLHLVMVAPGRFGPGDPAAVSAESKACRDDYLSVVGRYWERDQEYSEVLLQDVRQALASCLADAGISVLEGAPAGAFRALAGSGATPPDPEYIRCMGAIQEEYRVWGLSIE